MRCSPLLLDPLSAARRAPRLAGADLVVGRAGRPLAGPRPALGASLETCGRGAATPCGSPRPERTLEPLGGGFVAGRGDASGGGDGSAVPAPAGSDPRPAPQDGAHAAQDPTPARARPLAPLSLPADLTPPAA